MQRMLRTKMDDKVGNIIIELVPVDMMNNLVLGEFAPQVSFHNEPMFKDAPTVDNDLAVSLSGDSPFTVCDLMPEEGVTITGKSQVMGIAVSMPSDWFSASFDGANIRRGVSYEPSSNGIFQYSVHMSSLPTSIPQMQMEGKRNHGANRVNSVKPLTDDAEGNTEPSQGYTLGRCNDYRRGRVPLMTGTSARPETDDIVYSPWKHGVSRYVTDADGVSVTKPAAIAASGGFAMAGIASETIAAGSYGLIQVYGYHSAVRVRTMSTTGNGARGWVSLGVGSPLVGPLAAAFCLEAADTNSTVFISYPCAFALAVQGSYTTRTIAAFIKAL